MKKIFLTTMALLSIASAQVFGMYGVEAGTEWIDFLTDGNQFRARLNQLGFTLGNDTIKGTFGFHNDGRGTFGQMLSVVTNGETTSSGATVNNFFYDFIPTISMGLAYTSSLISVGVGYNATIGPRWNRYNNKTEPKKVEAVVHTPVLVLNALDNAFRMAIPIQVVHLTDKLDRVTNSGSVTAVSLEAQFRYYSGLEMLPQVRLYLKYGNYSYNYKQENVTGKGKIAESFGFDLRFYFGSMVEEVALQPIVKLAYNGALGKQHSKTKVTALDALDDTVTTMSNAQTGTFSSSYGGNQAWAQSAWDLELMLGLGLTANSDIVSLYLEPKLGLKVNQAGYADAASKVKEVYGLGYDVYAEIYITPIKNLEWYFEAELGNLATGGNPTLGFNSTTGVTWYLPQL